MQIHTVRVYETVSSHPHHNTNYKQHFAMDFVPIRDPNKPQEEELRVQGWRWVNTNSISPTQFNTSEVKISAGKPDRLGTHSHHGLSTHRVILGDLRIRKYQNAGGMYELSTALPTSKTIL